MSLSSRHFPYLSCPRPVLAALVASLVPPLCVLLKHSPAQHYHRPSSIVVTCLSTCPGAGDTACRQLLISSPELLQRVVEQRLQQMHSASLDPQDMEAEGAGGR
jgi:hypothetical protein